MPLAVPPGKAPRTQGKANLVCCQEETVSAHGVLHIHSAPPALCPHIEWAVAGVLGVPVDLSWVSQSAAPGTMRAELTWEGRPGIAALAALIALIRKRGYQHGKGGAAGSSEAEYDTESGLNVSG